MDVLEWLQRWYGAQCNGRWEHAYGVRIDTLDNPGWRVSIDLKETRASGARMVPLVTDRGEDDWVRCEVRDGVFLGHGDPGKLALILGQFRNLVEGADRVAE
jgi:immunity protein 53 of polymorphic toxin system